LMTNDLAKTPYERATLAGRDFTHYGE